MYAIQRLKGIPQLRDCRQPDTLQRWMTGRSRLRHCAGLSNRREPYSTRHRLFRVLAKPKTTKQDGENLNAPVDQKAIVATAETSTGKVSLVEDTESTSTTAQNVESRSYSSSFIPSPKVVTIIKNGLLLFLAITFLISIFRTLRKFLSPQAKRRRTINKNKELIEELMQYLPENRDGLTEKAAWMVRMKTGFTPIEVFRKYLWFLLRERKFDQSAVDDLICLKDSLKLTEADVAAALKERAQRIYDKYGSLMLNTEGMTAAGIERKATCQALFSKVLFLAEYDQLISQESEHLKEIDLNEIFGATEEDKNKLRIISLEEVDLDELDKMIEADEVAGSGSSEDDV